jgi:hypothetical protein
MTDDTCDICRSTIVGASNVNDRLMTTNVLLQYVGKMVWISQQRITWYVSRLCSFFTYYNLEPWFSTCFNSDLIFYIYISYICSNQCIIVRHPVQQHSYTMWNMRLRCRRLTSLYIALPGQPSMLVMTFCKWLECYLNIKKLIWTMLSAWYLGRHIVRLLGSANTFRCNS